MESVNQWAGTLSSTFVALWFVCTLVETAISGKAIQSAIFSPLTILFIGVAVVTWMQHFKVGF